ncbi:hypothetical protein RHMOL_Rhmol10G0123400 [Rhododendron molle]|nr:hypothetical protein RHMOL_Rhmol10G0123400 [Rhododendron molle]
MFDMAKTTILPGKDGAATEDCATVSYQGLNLGHDPADQTFYDDPTLSYSMGTPVDNWDEKRREWLKHHPSFATGAEDRVFVLTGSQPSPCKNPIGDHFNLRLFKNKLPLEKYKDHNLVVHGWSFLVYEKKSWGAVNAGVFFIRNCQWSMEFLEVWAEMGPQTPNYEKWGQILTSTMSDKMDPESDDQSALVYLLLKEKETWGKKIYIESEYDLSGYWVDIINSLDDIINNYARIEKGVTELRRRHAEKVSEHYAAEMRDAVANLRGDGGGRKWPFTTHFTVCRPCSGLHWGYTDEQCWGGMEKALNFADNQVLRNYGFVRPDLLNMSSLLPLPFGFASYNNEK